jgi:small GTP-binding protein
MGVASSTIYKKLIFCGDSGVGKTCLRKRLVDENEKNITTFNKNHIPTDNINFDPLTFKFQDNFIKLGIWDSCGQEKFQEINKFCYDENSLYLLVVDLEHNDTITKVKSNITKWTNQIMSVVGKGLKIPVIVLFNKVDKGSVNRNKFTKLQISSSLPRNFDLIDFLFVSAKSGENIEQLTSNILYYFGKLMDPFSFSFGAPAFECVRHPLKKRRIEETEELPDF